MLAMFAAAEGHADGVHPVWVRAVRGGPVRLHLLSARRRRAGRGQDTVSYLDERKEATYENLRDLNFEYKAGKLGEEDYAMQRAALEDEAAAILAEMDAIEARHKATPSRGKA